MEDPRPLNLKPNKYFADQGWPAVARDRDGHAISTCSREDEQVFREWLAECVDSGLVVEKLS